MGASILLSEKTISVMPLCVMPPPPKGGGFARSSPLGGAGTASAVTERVLAFYTYAPYSIRKRVIMQGFSLFFQDQAGQRGSFGPIGKITHQNGETFQWKCPQKTQHRLFFVRADDRPAV